MKKISLAYGLVFGSCLAALTAHAQEQEDSWIGRLTLSYRLGLNIKADFRNLGGFPAQTNPGPAAGGGINRNYDDGYNRVDISGNAGGQTWNWGYQNASQVVGSSIVMHSASSSAGASTGNNDGDPQHGFELGYHAPIGDLGGVKWGLEAAFGIMNVTVGSSQPFASDATLISDAFGFVGIPPLPPYSGTFAGPGQLISDTPTRTVSTIAGGALTTGQRNLDANLYSLRLGPYLEFPFCKRFSGSLSAGLSLAVVDSTFSFNESTSIAGAGIFSSAGRGSHSDLLVGAFVSGNLAYAITPRTSVFVGAQFQHLGDFKQTVGGRQAQLDLSKSIFVTAGVGFNF